MRPTLRRGSAVAIAASALLAVCSTLAVPADASVPAGTAGPARGATASVHSETGLASHANFTGIVRLSNCSGSIVRWKSSKPGDLAMMLTNGHCRKSYGADEVEVNVPSVRTVTLLKRDGTDAGTVSTTTLLYGTMAKTDVALYQLGVTYGELKSTYAVNALTIASHAPSPHERIVVISGYFRDAYRCYLNGFVYRLREDVYTWSHSLRYTDGGCDVIHGTSGSPDVKQGTRTIVGIHNTTNDNGLECTINNPCEVDRKGHITVHQGRHYGEQTWWFTTCLGADRQLDLDRKGCALRSP
jgi:hypothetical protein